MGVMVVTDEVIIRLMVVDMADMVVMEVIVDADIMVDIVDVVIMDIEHNMLEIWMKSMMMRRRRKRKRRNNFDWHCIYNILLLSNCLFGQFCFVFLHCFCAICYVIKLIIHYIIS